MSNAPQTVEAVAYALLQDVARSEDLTLGMVHVAGTPGDRRWILDTYAECLKAVKAEPIKAPPAHSRGAF